MTTEEFYGSSLLLLQQAEGQLKNDLTEYSNRHKQEGSLDGIQSICSRIKTPESMIKKLQMRGLSTDLTSALYLVHDALGIRVICSFTEGVYHLAEYLRKQSSFQILQEKDYISYPKANGYRSYHMILQFCEGRTSGLFAEVQIRTIAQDFWASLEHQIKYKHQIPHEALIQQELKRCADEIASLDLTMQTIQELIHPNSSD